MNPNNPQVQGLSMTAPESQSDFQRKEDHEIIKMQPGMHICRLYGIVDLGDQYNTRFNKTSRRIALLFEFPHIVQDFYVRKPGEEPKLQPSMVKIEEGFFMSSNSNLRKYVDGALGQRMSDDAAKNYNIFELLGKWFVANIILDPDKNNPQKYYERIQTLHPYDQRFAVQDVEYKEYNDLMAYSIDIHGFSGPNWLSLWNKMREKIKGSSQGQAHAAKGGVFEEPQKEGDQSSYQGTAPAPAAGPNQQGFQPQGPPANTGAPAGQAGPPQTNFEGQPIQQQSPAGPPQQAQPAAQPATQPGPAAPTVAPGAQPVQTEKVFVIKGEPKDFAEWQKNGWTQELMVQHGHAEWAESAV